jgi:hypothetical protein
MTIGTRALRVRLGPVTLNLSPEGPSLTLRSEPQLQLWRSKQLRRLHG